MAETNFVQSYETIRSALRATLMAEQDPDVLLSVAKLYCGFCWANHDGVYFDEDVEAYLTEKLAPCFAQELSACQKQDGDDVVLIASALFDAFGHSAVVDKWLRIMGGKCPHKLIVTRSIAEKISGKIKSYNVPVYRCTSRGIAGIKEILRAADSAKLIVLHTHPDDIGAVIAARLLKSIGITTVFYNHADHVFSYGISGADIVCEISLYGLKISKCSQRVSGKSILLGIPLTQTAYNSKEHEPATTTTGRLKTVLSCGSGYKYKPGGGHNFADLVNRVLEERKDVQIVLVGPSGKEKWWSDPISRWGARLRFTGILPADDYAGLLKTADVYVDSFPLCGGTSFPEALLAGVPTTGLNVPIQGYTFADELRVDTIDALLERVCRLLDEDAAALKDTEHVRAKVASYQVETAFASKLECLYSLKSDLAEEALDANGHCKLNDQFLHETWLNQKKIFLISRALRELPVVLKLKILTLVIMNARYMNFKNLMETVWVVLKTTLLPSFLRSRRS